MAKAIESKPEKDTFVSIHGIVKLLARILVGTSTGVCGRLACVERQHD